MAFGEQTFFPITYHRISGYAGSDSLKKARTSLARWIEDYYGEETFGELVDIRNVGSPDGAILSRRDVGLTLADNLFLSSSDVSKTVRVWLGLGLTGRLPDPVRTLFFTFYFTFKMNLHSARWTLTPIRFTSVVLDSSSLSDKRF
jgi:hypothetical protein